MQKCQRYLPDSPIEEQINYILYSDINPGLASHGGDVKLMEVVEEEEGHIAILQFGGGCQGCSAVDMTLKDGVERNPGESESACSGGCAGYHRPQCT